MAARRTSFRKRILPLLGIFLLPIASVGASDPAKPAIAAAPAAAAAPDRIGPEAMKGLTWDGLTEAQKQTVVSILNDNRCDCSCGMTLARCRRDDSTCGRSLALATQVIDLTRQGKGKDEVVKTALAPPASKFVQFALSAGDAPSSGPADASVTILHYYDYQCPYCVRARATVDELLKTYPNDVRVVFKQHPLPMHANAMIAAQGALAAQAQGKFPEMHGRLYESASSLSREKVLDLAKGLGLDMARFTTDLDSALVKSRIEAEAKEVEALGATGTPASFVNGRYVSGAKAVAFFAEMIDEELKWAGEKSRPAFATGKHVRDAMPPQAQKPQGPDPGKAYEFAVGASPVVGKADAKVTVVHFFDYQCPFCVRVGPTIEQLVKEYPGDVRIAYKHHPLPMHAQAMIAAEAAMAAQAQGKFAEMHAKLMENSHALSREKIVELASGLGLDVARFTRELDTHVHKPAIEAMTKEAMGIGATGTPATFVNGRYLSGAQPFEAFKKLVDEALAKPGAAAADKKPSAP